MASISKRVNGSWVSVSYGIMKTATDTITTLPADVYADGTNATVGLVGNMQQTGTPTPQNPITPSETGDRTANLLDYQFLFSENFVKETEYFKYYLFQLKPNTQYTIKTDYAQALSEVPFFFGISNTMTTNNDGVNQNVAKTITTGADGIAYLARRIKSAYGDIYIPSYSALASGTYYIMLNEGSTALPYEPNGIKIPILSANTTTPVYLGEVQSERKIIKHIFTGTETGFGKNSQASDNYLYYINLQSTGWIVAAESSNIYCSHLVETSATPTSENGVKMRNNGLFMYLNFGAAIMDSQTSGNTINGLKEYLADQYSAGTPVTVWYVLAETETGIVNEPLRKIGDYADTVSGITIPTIAGADSFDVQTTLKPSEITVNYHGWHTGAVHERESGAWTE